MSFGSTKAKAREQTLFIHVAIDRGHVFLAKQDQKVVTRRRHRSDVIDARREKRTFPLGAPSSQDAKPEKAPPPTGVEQRFLTKIKEIKGVVPVLTYNRDYS